jgi:hypothetical protein
MTCRGFCRAQVVDRGTDPCVGESLNFLPDGSVCVRCDHVRLRQNSIFARGFNLIAVAFRPRDISGRFAFALAGRSIDPDRDRVELPRNRQRAKSRTCHVRLRCGSRNLSIGSAGISKISRQKVFVLSAAPLFHALGGGIAPVKTRSATARRQRSSGFASTGKSIFVNPNKVRLSSPPAKNIIVPNFVKSCSYVHVPPRQEGRTRRHDREAGCDGR